ncbi:carboxypeptidase-like regulatory domain-containing protein [Reichenbachiella carrageenanivorans]|uniref:Carboxypeptidase-like regulatory domain-containing protein n=1 Tax=Reichenbachiella carrageenanivorans TaxID=2979869 RepID=A0ABY6CZ87_9BACT|nr:carboxypeptidase-like regulatory domain-containing protein [Reichenbachiella carrageenanivorans]UXX79222.1 carboxypeptidase-like regulatory domain-containing protein [Reichenbachiella carrageenanivorans]
MDVRSSIYILLGCILWLIALPASSQEPARPLITIDFKNTPLRQALSDVNTFDRVKLSYNPDHIPADRVVNESFQQVPLDLVLKKMLGANFDIKYRGSYIIIQPKKEEVKKHPVKLSGAVKDAETGAVIPDVTIYEINKLNATLTDTRGQFDLTVSAKTDYVTFAISRENYQDTIIQVQDISEMTLALQPIKKEKTSVKDRFEIETKKLVQFFTSDESQKNARNVRMDEERIWQVSLVPMIGSNGKLSGQVRNKISVNVLAGYAYGVNGVELGGLYNIGRREMNGLQMAGFGNAVGGASHGVQLAGFINTTKGYTHGVQAAGFLNVVTDDVKGVQAAGFVNISNKVNGVQAAGFVNLATKEMNGLQAAGFLNSAKTVQGAQVSGFLNKSKATRGAQISGFLNVTKTLKGMQLGIVNISDTVSSGTPIGLINIVRSGMHQFAAEHNDFMPYQVAFRSGIYRFYTVLSAGIDPSNNNLWSYGVGFGSQFTIRPKWYGNVELAAHNIEQPDRNADDLNLLNRLNLNVGYQIGKHLSVNAGPVLNLYLTKIYHADTDTYGDLDHPSFYESTQGDLHLSAWVGYAVSVRF